MDRPQGRALKGHVGVTESESILCLTLPVN
jgi:hypothetical protein